MAQYFIRTSDQLPQLLQAFRKDARLSQAEVALRLGVTQQTYSEMERNADKVGTARLLKLLNILGVNLVLNTSTVATSELDDSGPNQRDHRHLRPLW